MLERTRSHPPVIARLWVPQVVETLRCGRPELLITALLMSQNGDRVRNGTAHLNNMSHMVASASQVTKLVDCFGERLTADQKRKGKCTHIDL